MIIGSRYLISGVFILLLITLSFATGCTQTEENDQDIPDAAAEREHQVFIEKGERSPAMPESKVRITSPDELAVIDPGGEVFITLETSDFELGAQTETRRAAMIANSPEGQHIHVIVNNQPYIAIYEEGEVNIGELPGGSNTVFVFPSRSYHESIKSPGAYDYLLFYVGEEIGEFALDDNSPAIIYSRPKGTYRGADAVKIMLDFYLHNVELGSDYTAKYTVSEKDGSGERYTITLDEWKPAFIHNLDPGDYTVRLQLLDREGNVVEGEYNDTEHVITVKKE